MTVAVRVFHCDEPDARVPMIASDARLVVWPGVGAERANMNYVRMQPGEANVPHVHERSEDTIFVLAGQGTIADLDNGAELEFESGHVIHVPPGVRHQVRGDRGAEIVSVGGPCPADFGLLRAAGLWPTES
jgi:quercetin dioxygenase-like cupin family protein